MPKSLSAILAIAVFAVVIAVPLIHKSQAENESRNLRAVTPGVMYRSGQMSAAGVEKALDEYGIRTVISFRDTKVKTEAPPDEFEEALCESRGVAYHRFTPMNWSMPDGSVPAQENVDRFVKLIHDPKTQWPMLVHCFAGVHRTGTFTAIYRMEMEGWSSDDAVREMLTIAKDKPGFEADILSFLRAYQPRTPARRISSVK